MLLLGAIVSAERNAGVNELCSVIVPPLFVYVGLMYFFGQRYACKLLQKDTHIEKRIKVRVYGIVRVCCVVLLLICVVTFFSINKQWEIAIFFATALLGYSWIKFNTYATHLEYTPKSIVISKHKTRQIIPWEEVATISWVIPRSAIAYSIMICFKDGKFIRFSSSDFIGLSGLKSYFDSGCCEKTGDGP